MDRLTVMEIFTNVVEFEGFSAAARRLGISRASVSKQVIQLEESLGARLLNRTSRRPRWGRHITSGVNAFLPK